MKVLYIHNLIGSLKNSMRRYFYNPLFLLEIVTQSLNKIVLGDTVSGTAEN